MKEKKAFTLDDRLELIKNSGQITENVVRETKKVVQMIEEKYKIKLKEERRQDAMFVTHVTIALQRLVDGKEFDEIPSSVIQEVKGYPEEYEFAKEIVNKVEGDMNVKVPEAELGFIAAYICLVSGKVKLK